MKIGTLKLLEAMTANNEHSRARAFITQKLFEQGYLKTDFFASLFSAIEQYHNKKGIIALVELQVRDELTTTMLKTLRNKKLEDEIRGCL